jgi:hypothetical protein
MPSIAFAGGNNRNNQGQNTSPGWCDDRVRDRPLVSDVAFSTLTNLVDTRAGQVVTHLEKFSVQRDGSPFQSVDFNFWGVTLARDVGS